MLHKFGDILLRAVEALFLIAVFSFFLHLVTYFPRSADVLWRMATALSLILAVLLLSFWLERRSQAHSFAVWIVPSAFALGFWFFALLRHIGFTQWPLGRADTLRDYLVLLLSHSLLVCSVFSSFFLVAQKRASFEYLRWGNWGASLWGVWGKGLLSALAIGMWILALYTVITVQLPFSKGPLWFASIALIKAMLTGSAEEIAYRGIIQPLMIQRFGVTFGIIMQSCIYTAFHLHLGPVLCGQFGFLLGVMDLGLLFGLATRITGGIGWACTIHIAINWLVEWQNLS